MFSTLHTNDAPSTITRLKDMGVPTFLITATVEAIQAPYQPEHGAYGGGHHHSHHGDEEFNYGPRLHQFGVRK